MDETTAYRNKIGERITRQLAEALKNGQISQEEFSTISSHILSTIYEAKTNVDLLDFLSQLCAKWPMFSNLLTIEKTEGLGVVEEQKAQQVEQLIKQNRIDEAMHIAENTIKASHQLASETPIERKEDVHATTTST